MSDSLRFVVNDVDPVVVARFVLLINAISVGWSHDRIWSFWYDQYVTPDVNDAVASLADSILVAYYGVRQHEVRRLGIDAVYFHPDAPEFVTEPVINELKYLVTSTTRKSKKYTVSPTSRDFRREPFPETRISSPFYTEQTYTARRIREYYNALRRMDDEVGGGGEHAHKQDISPSSFLSYVGWNAQNSLVTDAVKTLRNHYSSSKSPPPLLSEVCCYAAYGVTGAQPFDSTVTSVTKRLVANSTFNRNDGVYRNGVHGCPYMSSPRALGLLLQAASDMQTVGTITSNITMYSAARFEFYDFIDSVKRLLVRGKLTIQVMPGDCLWACDVLSFNNERFDSVFAGNIVDTVGHMAVLTVAPPLIYVDGHLITYSRISSDINSLKDRLRVSLCGIARPFWTDLFGVRPLGFGGKSVSGDPEESEFFLNNYTPISPPIVYGREPSRPTVALHQVWVKTCIESESLWSYLYRPVSSAAIQCTRCHTMCMCIHDAGGVCQTCNGGNNADVTRGCVPLSFKGSPILAGAIVNALEALCLSNDTPSPKPMYGATVGTPTLWVRWLCGMLPRLSLSPYGLNDEIAYILEIVRNRLNQPILCNIDRFKNLWLGEVRAAAAVYGLPMNYTPNSNISILECIRSERERLRWFDVGLLSGIAIVHDPSIMVGTRHHINPSVCAYAPELQGYISEEEFMYLHSDVKMMVRYVTKTTAMLELKLLKSISTSAQMMFSSVVCPGPPGTFGVLITLADPVGSTDLMPMLVELSGNSRLTITGRTPGDPLAKRGVLTSSSIHRTIATSLVDVFSLTLPTVVPRTIPFIPHCCFHRNLNSYVLVQVTQHNTADVYILTDNLSLGSTHPSLSCSMTCHHHTCTVRISFGKHNGSPLYEEWVMNTSCPLTLDSNKMYTDLGALSGSKFTVPDFWRPHPQPLIVLLRCVRQPTSSLGLSLPYLGTLPWIRSGGYPVLSNQYPPPTRQCPLHDFIDKKVQDPVESTYTLSRTQCICGTPLQTSFAQCTTDLMSESSSVVCLSSLKSLLNFRRKLQGDAVENDDCVMLIDASCARKSLIPKDKHASSCSGARWPHGPSVLTDATVRINKDVLLAFDPYLGALYRVYAVPSGMSGYFADVMPFLTHKQMENKGISTSETVEFGSEAAGGMPSNMISTVLLWEFDQSLLVDFFIPALLQSSPYRGYHSLRPGCWLGRLAGTSGTCDADKTRAATCADVYVDGEISDSVSMMVMPVLYRLEQCDFQPEKIEKK